MIVGGSNGAVVAGGRVFARTRGPFALLAAAMAASTFSQQAYASAWSRDDGELMIISRADYFKSDLMNVSVGGTEVESKFERIESNNYFEYGVTSGLTVGGKVFYGTSWLTRGSNVETASGFTEFEAFVQQQVFRNERHAGAVKVAAGAPSGFESGARAGLESEGADLEFSLLYGRSLTFEPVKTFAAAEVGFRKRFGESADRMRFLTTIGLAPNDRWDLLFDTYSVKSLRNEGTGGADFDVIKIQPSVVWRATRRFSFQVGLSEEIAGRNLALGTTYFVGLRSRF